MVCVYKDTFYKDNMAKTYTFYFGPPLNKDNMSKIFKLVFFSEIIYNSPLVYKTPVFRKIWTEEQNKIFLFSKIYGI